jgi:hypothetical protein
MSQDNYTYVGPVLMEEGKFGVWTNCNASEENFPEGKPDEIFTNPLKAIIAAHRAERNDPTEYGVAFGKGVLEAAEMALQALESAPDATAAVGEG